MFKRGYILIGLASISVFVALNQAIDPESFSRQEFDWPNSGFAVIDRIYDYRRAGIGLSERCSPGYDPSNLLISTSFSQVDPKQILDSCIVNLMPVTDYSVGEDMVRRIYRASIDNYTCELTASYIRHAARYTGSDCGLAVFLSKNDPGIGIYSLADGG
jgi:hypothetical protein